MRYFLFFLLLVIPNSLYSQLSADYNLPVEVCLEEQFELENTSSNSSSYFWDFCGGEFRSLPAEVELKTIQGAADVRGNYLFYDSISSEYYYFNTTDNGRLFRTNLGTDLSLPYETTELSFSSGNFDRPQAIQIIKNDDDGNYYGYVGSRTNGFGISRINFGSDITSNEVSVDNLGTFGEGNIQIRDLKVYEENGEYFLLCLNLNASRFFLVKYGNSLANIPYAIVATSSFPNISLSNGFDLVNKDGAILAFVVGLSSNNIIRLNFGNSIETGFVFELEYDNDDFPSTLNRLSRIKMQENNGQYYAILNQFDSGNPTLTLDFKDLDIASIPEDLGYANSHFSEVSGGYFDGDYKYFGVNNEMLYMLNYSSVCGESISISNEYSPSLSYSISGNNLITLTAFNSNGNSSSITKEITVTNNQAPDITFSTGANLCIANPIEFSSESSSTISSYNWDFGDSNSSTNASPSHTYASAGTYAVKLSVSAANGCSNLFIDSVSVYEEPVPDFQATAQGSICTRKPIVFENLTTLPTEATFFWDLGDGSTSTEENPEHVYAESGEYTVSLSITMAGCTVEEMKTITVNPGPLVAFQTVNNCLGEILQFENMSQGDFLDTYQWDFGDGTLSTQANPSHLYDTAGVYTVQLSAFTTNGCDFTISQEVEIQALAEIDFQSEVACVGQPTQFTEQVSIDQANITDYFWDFGVLGTQSDISTEASPQFAFPVSGTYNVTLQVTTSDGCTTSGSQIITVQNSPQATFESEETCLDQMRLFIPEDTTNIITHFWELQNGEGEIIETSLNTAFSYEFPQAGTYQLTYRQENASLCSQSTTQSLTINEQPSPDFTWDTACAGEVIQLENLTDLKGNTLKNYSWSIGEDEELISTDFSPQFTFEESGEYLLNLEVETIGGCVQSLSKQINISPAPTAFYELSQSIGAYPFHLELDAEDVQTATSNFIWTLNSDTISTSSELNYTIEVLGTYLLGLLITNEAGCTAEYFEQIRVREPSLDVSLSNLRINQDGEFTSFLLNISNKGSLVPERIDLAIDLGSYSVTESLETPIYPEENSNFSLSLKLTEDQIRGLSKICISATPKEGDNADSNLQNNRICTNLEAGFKVMDIYPNPAVNQFIIPLITPENAQLTISMEDSNGRQVKVFNYDLEAGYNELRIERESLSPGIYFLRFRYQGQEKVKKIIFQ